MTAVQNSRGWAGIILLSGFMAAFISNLSGWSFHQWVGVAAGLLVGLQLVNQRGWLRAMPGCVKGKLPNRSRLLCLIDAALAAGVITNVGTGLVISAWLNSPMAKYAACRVTHAVTETINAARGFSLRSETQIAR